MHYGTRPIGLLQLPRWHGEPVLQGTYRERPEDFVVEEILGYRPAGEGPHWWLWVEKRGISTDEACARLSASLGVSRKEIGYAGKKDTHAITRQWFSVPATGREPKPGALDSAVAILDVSANARKLKVGQLQGNQFSIRLSVEAIGSIEARCQAIVADGVPNYFGLQRFGRNGSNLAAARHLAARDPAGRKRLHPKDGMAASAARSAGFNAIVAARIESGGWLQVDCDEAVMFGSGGSQFLADAHTLSSVRSRVEAGELHPSAPLGGRASRTGPLQAAAERELLAGDAQLWPWLQGVFAKEERRAVRVMPEALQWHLGDGTLELTFTLPRGCFATAVLNELGPCHEYDARSSA